MPHRIIIEIGTLAVDGWAATFGTARMGLGRPLLAVPNVTAHPSSASVGYQSPYCCIMVRCSAVLMCPKRLTDLQKVGETESSLSVRFRVER